MSRNSEGLFKAGVALVIVLVAVVAVIGSVAYFGSHTTAHSCTVDSKDRSVTVTSDSDGNVSSSTDYRVYTSCGVYTVSDNIFFGKFNAADTYGSLHEGSTYDLDVVGWRNGFFSMFPNILSAK